MDAEQRMEQQPPLPVRMLGKGLVRLVATRPALWPLLRGPTRRFFDGAAAGWDGRVDPDSPEHLAPLEAALGVLPGPPAAVLEVGTGTGSGALMLARRFPGLRVLGIDISEAMVEAARAKVPPELADRVDLRVADAAAVPSGDAEFDLVILVNAPVFFGEIARVLQPGGHAAVVSSLGTRTPFHTPAKLLDRGFRRAGMERVERGQAGAGLYYVARKD